MSSRNCRSIPLRSTGSAPAATSLPMAKRDDIEFWRSSSIFLRNYTLKRTNLSISWKNYWILYGFFQSTKFLLQFNEVFPRFEFTVSQFQIIHFCILYCFGGVLALSRIISLSASFLLYLFHFHLLLPLLTMIFFLSLIPWKYRTTTLWAIIHMHNTFHDRFINSDHHNTRQGCDLSQKWMQDNLRRMRFWDKKGFNVIIFELQSYWIVRSTILWDVMSCSFVEVYWMFWSSILPKNKEASRLHYVTFWKTVLFVKTQYLLLEYVTQTYCLIRLWAIYKHTFAHIIL